MKPDQQGNGPATTVKQPMPPAPSGAQFEIAFENHHAVIVEVGGGIRTYEVDGRRVLEPYAVDQACDGAHGATLIPWPNRLGEGRYRFEGTEHQVALTEPAKDNAIHGLLRWRPWRALDHGDTRVVMGTTLFPMMGYPFALEVTVDYQLAETGLSVTASATNIGDRPAPYGCGHHPYLSPAVGLVDDCILHLDADTRILTDPERQLPTGTEDVGGTPFDFRGGKRIGHLAIDDAFTDLRRDEAGRAWVRLLSDDGSAVELWVDQAYPYVEIYTGDTLVPERRRRGLGTEPMTCPPNALQTGTGVIRLEPGATSTAQWGIRLSGLQGSRT